MNDLLLTAAVIPTNEKRALGNRRRGGILPPAFSRRGGILPPAFVTTLFS
ncbi:MAG: hypothetical protein FWF41_05580 [Betaproteobacteria bacterium]|nr:hypothetical protein [Betaproteobacteria bacterium]